VRQLDFKSKSLSLFDLAVLANTVHIHAPLYSLLGNHCFWFANIICDVLEQEYPLCVNLDHHFGLNLPGNSPGADDTKGSSCPSLSLALSISWNQLLFLTSLYSLISTLSTQLITIPPSWFDRP
jgi:hypothetical protein